jgi:hypothetical protein
MSRVLRHLVSLALLGVPLAASASEGDWSARSFQFEGAGSHPVLVLDTPAVGGDGYAVTGRVAYQDVQGDGYLEMWSVFPDGSRYFSRTLAASGPMAKLRGSSPERAFALPFRLQPGARGPVRLEVNAVLPAGGRVTLHGLRLESGAGGALAAPGAWWSDATGGWLGAAAGSAFGLLGALVGTLASLGRGRRVALGALLALCTGGLVALAAGAAALATGQPYAVWYPLVLLGVLGPVLGLSLRGTVRRRFEAVELRRMQALDARS